MNEAERKAFEEWWGNRMRSSDAYIFPREIYMAGLTAGRKDVAELVEAVEGLNISTDIGVFQELLDGVLALAAEIKAEQN